MLAKDGILQGRYRIIRQLGYGGMGAVYEAVDERFGQPVALKEIIVASVNENQNSLIIDAFEREAKSLAKARHEAIPYVRDYFSEAEKQFLVMELVEGEDLAEMLKKRGKPFPLEDVVNWADQLLDALDYLHNLDPPIIHRDIKPHNLKLSFRRKIKLLDFGIAKSGENKSAITNQTFIGATLDYSPIEQILRVIDATFREFIILKHKEKAEKVLSQHTDLRCDIYALGATFYHLLTNREPEDATARTLAIWEGKKDPLPNPSQLNPEIPPLISACLLKAMEIERDNRFSSAIEMQKMLQWAIAEGKAKKNEETLPLSEAQRLRIVGEKIPEQNLTSLATKKLIPEFDIKEIEKEFFPSVSVLPTEPLKMPPSDTKPPPEFTVQESDFQPSKNIVKAESTKEVRFEEVLPEKSKSVFESFPLMEKEIKTDSKNDAKLFWLLPLTALCILIISGIGALMWFGSSDSTNSNKPATKIVISTPTATVSPTEAASPNVPPTPAPKTEKPTKSNEIIKPSVPSKPSKTPIQSPIKMPPPPKTPKPSKRTYSDDCIYNRKCG